MNSAISEWNQIKKSGHFKRSVEVACNEEANLEDTTILASASSDNTEVACNEEANLEDTTILASASSDNTDEENTDTDDENLMHSLSEIEKNIKIKEQLRMWATSFYQFVGTIVNSFLLFWTVSSILNILYRI
ncbi:hypothetical protein JTB14_031532 [Gonioctena quinquepunctata]|nr:hypothetical protein JTB14_031532 [Gonioctena quinquepunctata]